MCTLCQSLSVQQQIDFHANGDTFAEFFESTDAAANSGTIYSLGLGDILYGSLTASTDTADWVAVSIPAGATYFFYGVDIYRSGNDNPVITLVNSAGTVLAAELGYSAYDSYTTYTNSSGSAITAYIKVEEYSASNLDYGVTAYNLLTEGGSDAGATTGSASAAALGMQSTDVVFGTVGGADSADWYEFSLAAGKTLEVWVHESGTDDAVQNNPVVNIYDASGTLVASWASTDSIQTMVEYSNGSGSTQILYIEIEQYDFGYGTVNADYGFLTNVYDTPILTEYTNQQIADQLISGYWDSVSAPNPVAWDVDPTSGTAADYTIDVDISRLTAQGQAFATAALAAWTAMTGIEFNFTSLSTLSTDPNNANYLEAGAGISGFIFDDQDLGSAYAFWNTSGSHTTSLGSTSTINYAGINIGSDWLNGDYNVSTGEIYLDSYSFQTYIHEIGHALGLGHAGNYNGSASYPNDANYLNDSWQATVMSYFSQTENTYIDASYAYLLTPMIADIIAMQDLYGIDGGRRLGDTTYGFNSTAGGYYDDIVNLSLVTAFTILDDGGIDTLDLSGFGVDQMIDLTPGAISDVAGKVGNMIIYSDGEGEATLIENVIGGSAADTIYGNDANNILNGVAGNDSLYGGNGDDTFMAGTGDDFISGGIGVDTIDYSEFSTAIKINLKVNGNQTLAGTAGTDKFASIENIVGGSGNDTLNGSTKANSLYGGDGKDILNGKEGHDYLVGGDGNDNIKGYGGNDTIIGGAGRDVMYGNAGADVFIYLDASDSTVGGQRDVISGFVNGQDIIDLSAIDAIAGGGDDAFNFIGSSSFAGAGAGALRAYVTGSGVLLVEGDIDGDGNADFQIQITGTTFMTSADFIL